MRTTMPTMRYFFCKSPTTMPTMRYFSNTRKHTITNQTWTKCMFEISQPHTFYLTHTAIPTKNYSFSFPAVSICPFFNNNSATSSQPNCTAIIRSYRSYDHCALRSRGHTHVWQIQTQQNKCDDTLLMSTFLHTQNFNNHFLQNSC